jgi:hypothetical protein
MNWDGKGKPEDAGRLFQQAWNESTNNFEKFIAAQRQPLSLLLKTCINLRA